MNRQCNFVMCLSFSRDARELDEEQKLLCNISTEDDDLIN